MYLTITQIYCEFRKYGLDHVYITMYIQYFYYDCVVVLLDLYILCFSTTVFLLISQMYH